LVEIVEREEIVLENTFCCAVEALWLYRGYCPKREMIQKPARLCDMLSAGQAVWASNCFCVHGTGTAQEWWV
jgi:hypothetical protein